MRGLRGGGSGVRNLFFVYFSMAQEDCYVIYLEHLENIFLNFKGGGIYNSQHLVFDWSPHSKIWLDFISKKVGHIILFQDKILGGPFA